MPVVEMGVSFLVFLALSLACSAVVAGVSVVVSWLVAAGAYLGAAVAALAAFFAGLCLGVVYSRAEACSDLARVLERLPGGVSVDCDRLFERALRDKWAYVSNFTVKAVVILFPLLVMYYGGGGVDYADDLLPDFGSVSTSAVRALARGSPDLVLLGSVVEHLPAVFRDVVGAGLGGLGLVLLFLFAFYLVDLSALFMPLYRAMVGGGLAEALLELLDRGRGEHVEAVGRLGGDAFCAAADRVARELRERGAGRFAVEELAGSVERRASRSCLVRTLVAKLVKLAVVGGVLLLVGYFAG